MPVYEYGCPKCGHHFEQRQSFDSEPVAPCPECKSSARRRLSTPAIVFKGSGFYKTDSRGPEKSDSKSESTGSESSSPSKNASDDTKSSKDTSSKDASSKDTSSKPKADKKVT